MKGYARTITSTGSDWQEELSTPPSLEFLQKMVDGYIEVVPYFDTIVVDGTLHQCVAYCNEEGKLNGLSVNGRATVFWADAVERKFKSRRLNDVLVGDVVILFGDDEFMSEL